jgi:cytochrome c-type biogenesis protein CcmH/NrfG
MVTEFMNQLNNLPKGTEKISAVVKNLEEKVAKNPEDVATLHSLGHFNF